MSHKFKVVSDFRPAGDQPEAIARLCGNMESGTKNQVLLGVTGSGKTFTIAKVIEKMQRPALIMSPNKVLAAQLYAEFKAFFPDNAVEYFISYYDYYQPEAYVPQTDTYIEKDADINEHIDKLRLKATTSILTRPDTIVVASVSCIYNIGSPESFAAMCIQLEKGKRITRSQLSSLLVQIRYERNELDFTQGKFRMRGNSVDIFPPYSQTGLRVNIGTEAVESIQEFHPVTGDIIGVQDKAWIYPSKHFVSKQEELERAVGDIKTEMKARVAELTAQNKLVEAQRLEQRTKYDTEMIMQTGYCGGVENYSRHLSGRPPGSRPLCLIDYFYNASRESGVPFMMFMDESHVSLPQVRGMFEGDRARKQTLVDFGFRLPSALDNRPLKFAEFEELMPQTVFVSATPGPYELQKSAPASKPVIVEQIIRPTGLVDPVVTVHPTKGQINHLMEKIRARAAKKEKTLVLSLTKRTAEDLAAFLAEKGIRARHMHSDMDTLERISILNGLRSGEFDALVGINLLREGIDIPEVSLVAILEADNEGFLRSETTLIQIAGRAARNSGGEVLLYADRVTGSMKRAIAEMDRRRIKQEDYNTAHGITPKTIIKAMVKLEEFQKEAKKTGLTMLQMPDGKPPTPHQLPLLMQDIEKQMREAADNLDFELAASLRDRLFELREMAVPRDAKPKKATRRPKK